MQFAKIVFRVAGIYGLIVLSPMYFMEGMIGRQTPPPITHPEYFYGFLGTAIAWQVVFLVLSSDPARYRAMILPSVLEKIPYAITVAILFAQRRIVPSAAVFGIVDCILGFLFLAAYFKTKPLPPVA
jgi:hypothetical protein